MERKQDIWIFDIIKTGKLVSVRDNQQVNDQTVFMYGFEYDN